jgi:hypothetical protein
MTRACARVESTPRPGIRSQARTHSFSGTYSFVLRHVLIRSQARTHSISGTYSFVLRYVLIRSLFALEREEFKAFWATHPDERKRTRTGLENRWSRFFNSDGGGKFRYSGACCVVVTEATGCGAWLTDLFAQWGCNGRYYRAPPHTA